MLWWRYAPDTNTALAKDEQDIAGNDLVTCRELEKEPNRFFKGVFNVRTSTELHRDLAVMAEKKKMKLNELVNIAFDFLVKNEEKVLD